MTIPRTSNPYRIEENYNIFDFELTEEDMEKIDALKHNKHFGDHPDDYKLAKKRLTQKVVK